MINHYAQKILCSVEETGTNEIKFAFLLVFGNQAVYGDKFVIDFYMGAGLGIANRELDFETYPYAFSVMNNWALSGGIRVGILLK